MPPPPPPPPGLRERVARLPREPGVYLWKSAAGEVLYVGKAIDLRSRVSSYLAEREVKSARLMEHAADVDYIAVRNEKEALVLEQTLIKRHRPRYNVRLTDDKHYPYLKLTAEPYPRLVKTYRYSDDGATYFGPFPDGYGAFHVLQALNDLIPLRRCKTLPRQKCLYYDIGKCVAPCIAACTDEEYDALVDEARLLLKGQAKDVTRRLRERLDAAAQGMRFEEAARLRDQLLGLQGVLERQHMTAEHVQDRDVAALEAVGEVGVVVVLHQRDGQIVGQSPFTLTLAGVPQDQALADFLRGHYTDRTVPRYVAAEMAEPVRAALEVDLRLLRAGAVTVEAPQRGEKVRWLEVAHQNARLRLVEETERRRRRGMGAVEALQAALGLPAAPRRIEGFDVSHHGGRHTRAALVTFVDGEPAKSQYRTFAMREVGEDAVAAGTAAAQHGAGREVDDYASLAEAVLRRYRRLRDEGQPMPDLVLVDGGRGQLEAARGALRALGLEALPLASLAKKEEEVHLPRRLHPLRLGRDDPALQLLQRVRDEAHRFGISQVRRKATSGVTRSPLDDVPGIGPKRRAELVKAFAGLAGLKAASVDDLTRVRGVTRAMAEAIVAALQANGAQPPAGDAPEGDAVDDMGDEAGGAGETDGDAADGSADGAVAAGRTDATERPRAPDGAAGA